MMPNDLYFANQSNQDLLPMIYEYKLNMIMFIDDTKVVSLRKKDMSRILVILDFINRRESSIVGLL